MEEYTDVTLENTFTNKYSSWEKNCIVNLLEIRLFVLIFPFFFSFFGRRVAGFQIKRMVFRNATVYTFT